MILFQCTKAFLLKYEIEKKMDKKGHFFTLLHYNQCKKSSDMTRPIMVPPNQFQQRDDEALLSPLEIAKEIPFNLEHQKSILQWRHEVEKILLGADNRLLVIVGPCSIHNSALTLEYGQKLKRLAEKLSSRLFIIMRTYFEKPRTITGWKGFLHDPNLDGSYECHKGIRKTRSLLVDLTEMGIPCASELLELTTTPYYADFLTWGCIGARTASSQPHRHLASAMSFPVGFKNSIDGNIDHSIHGIIAASMAQTFLGIGATGHVKRIQSEGNPYCHLVLRGSHYGSNYDKIHLQEATLACLHAGIGSSIIVDCAHDNANKDPLKQITIFKEVLSTTRPLIKGLMLESNLYKGRQKLTSALKYGVSVTDPCLDWASTEKLLLWAYATLT